MIEKKRKLCFVWDDYIEQSIINYCYKKLLPINKVFTSAWLSSSCYYISKKKGKIGISAIRSLKHIGVRIDETKLTRAPEDFNS